VWPAGSVYCILRNEKYCGDVLMQKTFTPDCLSHRVVKNRGQERQYRLRDHHPAIVSRSDWNTAQEMLSSRRHRKHKSKKEKYINRVRLKPIKGGRFKGFAVYDPSWKNEDIPIIVQKLTIKPTRKGVNEDA
jgi:hypothetical protein